jgi:tetratricopeptide (TPR) repeat protein
MKQNRNDFQLNVFKMNLDLNDQRCLEAATGWLELGNHLEANEELENITPQMRAHPAVLLVRYEVYAKAEKWDGASEIAGALVKLLPEQPSVWICLAYATRRKPNGGIPEAMKILLEAESKFPRVCQFPFNIACYCSQKFDFEEAERWLKKAIAIDEKTVQKLAIDDPDLLPLWDSMGGTLWKRV